MTLRYSWATFLARLGKHAFSHSSPHLQRCLPRHAKRPQVPLLPAQFQGCGVLDERALASVAYQALHFIHSCHDNGLLYGRLQQQ